MKKSMWTIVILIFLSIHSFGVSRIEVKDVWVREFPAASSVTAVYMVIENKGNEDDRLIEVKTDVSNNAVIHNTLVDEKGIAKMGKFEYINMPSGKSVEIKPSGSHIMLIGLNKSLKARAQVKGMQSHYYKEDRNHVLQ